MKVNPPTYKKLQFSVRLSEDIIYMIENLLDTMEMDRRTFLELSILNFIEQLDRDKFIINGFDSVEYSKIRKTRMIRQMEGIYRTEIKSKNLFIKRTEQDVLEMLLAHSPLTEIKRLLLARKSEARHYKNNDEIIETLNKYMNLTERDYKKTIIDIRGNIYTDTEVLKQPKRVMELLTEDLKKMKQAEE